MTAEIVRRVGRPAKVEQIAPARSENERILAVNRYHQAARSAAGQAVYFAVCCGLELHAVKAAVGHGPLTAWVEKHCHFCDRTARNYMALAERTVDRISNRKHVSDLLAIPPSAMNAEQTQTLVDAIKPIVGDNSLRQMYLDFGILREPAAVKIGGDTSMYRKSASEADEAKKALYRDLWKKTAKQIRAMGESWRFLEEADRREIGETFWALGRLMRE